MLVSGGVGEQDLELSSKALDLTSHQKSEMALEGGLLRLGRAGGCERRWEGRRWEGRSPPCRGGGALYAGISRALLAPVRHLATS